MKKVWAEFEVREELELSDIALVLEVRFGAAGTTATVWDDTKSGQRIASLLDIASSEADAAAENERNSNDPYTHLAQLIDSALAAAEELEA